MVLLTVVSWVFVKVVLTAVTMVQTMAAVMAVM